MDRIIIDPETVYSVFLGICGLIITASGAFAVIERAVKHFKAPQESDRKHIEEIDERVTANEKHLEKIDEFLEHDDKRLNDFADSDRTTKEALLALLNHAFDGSNTDDVKAAKKNLERYLIDK